jgi:hypothetical protein
MEFPIFVRLFVVAEITMCFSVNHSALESIPTAKLKSL